MNKIVFLFLWIPIFFYGQNKINRDSLLANEYPKFEAKNLIFPAVTIGYGFLALNSNTLIKLNEDIHDKLVGDNEFKADDFTLFIPALSVFAIDVFTKKAQHRFGDRTLILVMAAAMANGTTFALKAITDEERPYGGKFNSFPSGHTTNAFVSAEFLRQEFKHVSPWYGIAGYGMAITTAYLRMYNNQHWFSDVLAAAGIGVLSTQAAYWIYPWLKYKVFKAKKNTQWQAALYPSLEANQWQVGAVIRF